MHTCQRPCGREQCWIKLGGPSVELPDMIRIVGAVDPSGTKGDRGITTGIIVAGKGVDGLAYILADWSCRLSPAAWGRRAVDAYKSGYRPPTSRVARFG